MEQIMGETGMPEMVFDYESQVESMWTKLSMFYVDMGPPIKIKTLGPMPDLSNYRSIYRGYCQAEGWDRSAFKDGIKAYKADYNIWVSLAGKDVSFPFFDPELHDELVIDNSFAGSPYPDFGDLMTRERIRGCWGAQMTR